MIEDKRRTHDMGGTPAGEIDMAEHEAEPWQKMVTAIRAALGGEPRRLMRVDELRRAIEDLDAADYERPYFERWAEAMVALMEEKGLLTRAEVEARMADIRKRLEG